MLVWAKFNSTIKMNKEIDFTLSLCRFLDPEEDKIILYE
jgi:hypothetical protein